MTELTRRRLLASAGVGAAGVGLGGAAGYLIGDENAAAASNGTGTVPFYGEHQAGIDTPVQDRLHFAAFDLVDDSQRLPAGTARRHRRDRRPAPLQPHHHLRLRSLAVRKALARPERQAAGGAA